MKNKFKIKFLKSDRERFIAADPFPSIVIDNLFDRSLMNEIYNSYPKKDDVSWWSYNNHFERKLAFDRVQDLDACFQEYFNFVNSYSFVRKLEYITGIEGIISDPSLRGGGLHMIESGGKLDVHADFNYHSVTGWKRQLNMITFLNKDWRPEYNGHLELWNKEMTKCEKRVSPEFNRTVIFKTSDDTYHGHPDPLCCPPEIFRKSLAVYYYTHHEDNLDNLEYRSTDYQKRPLDNNSEELEALRLKRRKGRLKDSKT